MAAVPFTLQPTSVDDFEALLALRLRAMRESLQRLGRYDEQRARERLAKGFDPGATQHIVVDGQRVGFVVLKTLRHALRLDHLYIDPPFQGRGIGHAVLTAICADADARQLPIELVVLKYAPSRSQATAAPRGGAGRPAQPDLPAGRDAGRFYQRHGFAEVGEGEWDLDFLRQPLLPSVRAVRALWAAVQARDWGAMRALLKDDLQVRWWTSGERFTTADAYVEVQRRYPEGWAILLLEAQRLDDGRVLAVVRVDHAPQRFFCTAVARVDNGVIGAIDEYWATLEAPPDWRTPTAITGLVRFDPADDPRAVAP